MLSWRFTATTAMSGTNRRVTIDACGAGLISARRCGSSTPLATSSGGTLRMGLRARKRIISAFEADDDDILDYMETYAGKEE